MTRTDYVVWATKPESDMCKLSELRGVDSLFELNKGTPRATGFPADATFAMDPERPTATILTDNLFNTDRLIVISSRLRTLIESFHPRSVEFLPVKVLDHKGKPAPGDYSILHPIDTVDCLDAAASGAKWGKIVKTRIDSVQRIVLAPGKVPEDRVIFKTSTFTKVALIRRDVAEAIVDSRFTGFRPIELDHYPED